MKKIAIVGSGISGLVCAYVLSRKYHVTLFEANDYIGGHTATKRVIAEGKEWDIDTGFIVFNDRTYPNFIELLSQLGIKGQESEMSFSVKNVISGLEYNGHNLNTLFAQRSNIFNTKFLSLISEILRFNKQCKELWEREHIDTDSTLGDMLYDDGYSTYFAEHYILPMGAAIWSSSLQDMKAFPLHFFIRFFHNHGLLDIANRPQWYVIPNGSSSYISPLIERFKDNIHLNSPVTGISRHSEGISLTIKNTEVHEFDEVILACHSNQSLAMLTDVTNREKEVLSKLTYQENEVVLHTDETLLPMQKRAWAAWNYHLDVTDKNRPSSVTYNMNILQGLNTEDTTFCVTLNNSPLINESKILGSYKYDHPVFNADTISSQQRRNEICGHNHTHFAGAYWYNGFHEDGVRSALDVCQRFGLSL
ncbi:FAD-dependent oxidoreductase [Aliivibrio finisterrensis]|uniref:FAD-dependent oxidoreductase n=1 Tax=Aliivibrio finisterrensis TaxID=511998 RepID=A0A4Q5KNS5_9GAMM|nr:MULTISPECIES: FAD-dependent oxidoreductase [Aliivibrio]MDD9174110.1 FAD-dependent oxidoreductase [Aliivibrio sp. S3TY1]MDD9191187.1 FAD-dependent oxidoreductase [Aliivibrio sp. S2TY2]RYU48111.1 FAD-dependent oxidoreductase [Aliivibrio finisterrensis]